MAHDLKYQAKLPFRADIGMHTDNNPNHFVRQKTHGAATGKVVATICLISSLVLGPYFAVAAPEIPSDEIPGNRPAVYSATPSSPYLNWYPRSQLSVEQQAMMPSFCSGRYQVPNIDARTDEGIEATADSARLIANERTELQGQVELRQADRIITTEQAVWDQQAEIVQLNGAVKLVSPDLIIEGQQAELQQTNQNLQMEALQYALPNQHARGSAAKLTGVAGNTLVLSDASFTFCEPGQNDWDIAASRLILNQQNGFGSAWNTRLRVAGVPILYIPYYRFPIDDRRMTGFLDPSFSFNGKGQVTNLEIPFYLNIATNFDATLTPQRVIERGIVVNSQIRHKTQWLGDGEFNYSVLDKDEQTDTKRFRINYLQTGQWSDNWRHRFEYNQLSDDDYLNDMRPSGAVNRASYLPRRALIAYQNDGFEAQLMTEEFQTINSDIALNNRPYHRAPELKLNYRFDNLQGLQFQQRLTSTLFSRQQQAQINGQQRVLSGDDSIEAARYVSDSNLAYRWQYPFGFIEPRIDYRHRYYRFSNIDDSAPTTFDRHQDFGSARYQLDGQLIFERALALGQHNFLQTLEPRILYSYSRLRRGQNEIPLFDTRATSFNFANLFSGDRFRGDDRLADLNQTSIGVTSRLINTEGIERLRASLGRIYYHTEQITQLDNDNEQQNQSSSPILAELEWTPNRSLQLTTTLEWDNKNEFLAQQRIGLSYLGSSNRFFNLASNRIQTFDQSTQQERVTSDQIDAGIFWSLTDSWAIFGRQLFDLQKYEDGQPQPIDDSLESMAGLEYQSCCWRIQASYRESSLQGNDDNPEFNTEKRYGFLLSFELKGLGSFGDDTDRLIKDAVAGYANRQYHNY